MIKTTTFLSLALLPHHYHHQEPEWGQLSRGGVEWVASISQYRKWGGGCSLRSCGDGVLAFWIALVQLGRK